MNGIVKESLLYDFYGNLLSDRQREVFDLHNEENMSLAEIAAEFDISRSAVHDSLKKGEKALQEYEKKLGLLEKFEKREAVKEKIKKQLEEIKNDFSEGKTNREGIIDQVVAEIDKL